VAGATCASNVHSESQLAFRDCRFRLAELDRLAEEAAGPLLIDEAYVDFADNHALPLARRKKHHRYAHAQQVVFAGPASASVLAVAEPALVHELVKVKDSYNCDVLSLTAAAAALEDQEYLRTVSE